MHYLIGKTISENQPQKSIKHLISAGEIFRKLGIKSICREIEERVKDQTENAKVEEKKSGVKKPTTVSSQLLMLRLAEATASRELIFRELVAILRQESRADKIIIAEINDEKNFYPFITHGYTPDEGLQIVRQTSGAHITKMIWIDLEKRKMFRCFTFARQVRIPLF